MKEGWTFFVTEEKANFTNLDKCVKLFGFDCGFGSDLVCDFGSDFVCNIGSDFVCGFGMI
jgi:hypothetical protein